MKSYKPGSFFHMHSKRIIILIFIALSAVIGWQCSSALYQPLENNVPPGSTLADLKTGRELYINNCGSCHMLHLPGEFTEQQWQKNLHEMSERAKLNPEQTALILKYLTSTPKKLSAK